MQSEVNHSTLGLAMIMKNEIEDLERIVKNYGSFFDKIYITVTDKKTYMALQDHFIDNLYVANIVEFSYFKWLDHFGKARIYNQKQIKTDYWMWLDMDDDIEGAVNIPAVIEYMRANRLDEVWFRYDYIRRISITEPESVTWRERIIRTNSMLGWSDDPVHENINALGDDERQFVSYVAIKHRRTAVQVPLSRERNRLILEKDWILSKRASTAWYLGSSSKEMGDYEDAIEKLIFVTEHGEGWALRFLAWQNIGECYFHNGRYTEALIAASKCTTISPDHPLPWYQKFNVYRAMGDIDLALQSAEIAMSKKVDAEQAILLGSDPSLYEYRGPFDIARTYISVGNFDRAYQLYDIVKNVAPWYIEELRTEGSQWSNAFEQAYNRK